MTMKLSQPTITPRKGAMLEYLDKYGRFPPVTLSVFPLEGFTKSADKVNLQGSIYFDRFISYRFQSSITIPVDTFTCEVYYRPVDGVPRPKEGDIFVLRANGIPLSTGIVDQLDMETDGRSGTKLTIQGRDLLGMWEDQDSVSPSSDIIWSNTITIKNVIRRLSAATRIDPETIILRDAPRRPYLFATQPGESKLSSLQRYCEALDIYFWMNGDGRLIIGKPDVHGVNGNFGSIYLKLSPAISNVLSMRSSRNSTQVPGIILPIWMGQENVSSRVSPSQGLANKAAGPVRLMSHGHIITKACVVSTPEGSAPQDLAEINTILVAGQQRESGVTKAGANTILQAYAKREMARENMKCLSITATVAGHFNDSATPLVVDQTYRIQYEPDEVDEDMYLHDVEYFMSEGEGQRTRLTFCQQTSLVSDTRAL